MSKYWLWKSVKYKSCWQVDNANDFHYMRYELHIYVHNTLNHKSYQINKDLLQVSNFLSLWTTTTSCLIIFKGIMYIILFLLMCMILILDVYDFLYSLGHIKNREFNWLIFGTHTRMDHLVLLNEVLSWRKYNVSMEWNF